MITNPRILDDVVLALGERYDVGKVLDAMCGIVADYADFAKAKGLAEPYTLSSGRPSRPRKGRVRVPRGRPRKGRVRVPRDKPDDDWLVKLMRLVEIPIKLPYGRHTARMVRLLVEKERLEYDVGGLRHAVEAPPFRFNLYPLGPNPLFANFGICREPGVDVPCLTVDVQPWTEFDPAPTLLICRHLPARPIGETSQRSIDECRLTLAQRKLLTEFLETQRPRGISFEPGANGLVTDPVAVRFPHETFGAGIGDIRIALLRAGGD